MHNKSLFGRAPAGSGSTENGFGSGFSGGAALLMELEANVW
jgi:hypothetical protein